MATSHKTLKQGTGTLTLTLSHDDMMHVLGGGGIWFRDVELPKGKLTIVIDAKVEQQSNRVA